MKEKQKEKDKHIKEEFTEKYNLYIEFVEEINITSEPKELLKDEIKDI